MNNGKNGAGATTLARPQFVTNDQGEQIGVFLDIASYRKLIEEVEDSRDLKLIEETVGDEPIPWEAAKTHLKRQGKL